MSFIEQVKESVEKAAEEMREFNESVRSTVIYKSMKANPLCMNQMPDIQLFMAGILSGIA